MRRFTCSLAIVAGLLLAFCSGIAHAQSQSVSVAGGTLNFDVSSNSGTLTCGWLDSPRYVNYTTWDYENFSFTSGSGTTSLPGGTTYTFVNGPANDCDEPPPGSGPLPYQFVLEDSDTIVNFNVSGRFANVFASVGGYRLRPAFKVASILYATPGNASSDSFTNTLTNGTNTSIGSSFTSGISTTFSFGFSSIFSVSASFGASVTNGRTDSFTEAISNAVSIGNASYSQGPNTINHSQDLFLVWLNPEITLYPNGSSQYDYSIDTATINGSHPQADIVEVYGSALQADGNGASSVPIAVLRRQYDPQTGAYDLPGLGALCVDQSQYVNNCPVGGQCGCVPSDFTGIVATNPLLSGNPSLNATTTANPLDYNGSTPSTCTNPVSTDSCRYIPIRAVQGSPAQRITTLAGPSAPGGNRPVNGFTQTDAVTNGVTFNTGNTETASYSTKAGAGLGPSVTSTTTFTWTNTSSQGVTNGQSNQLQYSLSSSTPGCYQNVLLYEDTVYHTFVTQQEPGNTTCP